MTGRFSQCDDTCTTNCGHQKEGRPAIPPTNPLLMATLDDNPVVSLTAVEPLHPLGRHCCGAPDSTACHQRGLCVAEGVHPSVVPEPDTAVREQVARWLAGGSIAEWWPSVAESVRAPWIAKADELLAVVEDAASTARSTATVPEVERPANQLDDHWDSGLRARVEALAEEWNDQANQLTRQADEATERREFAYVSFWLGKADSYAGTAAQLRRALGGEQ